MHHQKCFPRTPTLMTGPSRLGRVIAIVLLDLTFCYKRTNQTMTLCHATHTSMCTCTRVSCSCLTCLDLSSGGLHAHLGRGVVDHEEDANRLSASLTCARCARTHARVRAHAHTCDRDRHPKSAKDIRTHMHTHIAYHMYIYIYIYIAYVCIYIYIYISICIHTHVHRVHVLTHKDLHSLF